MVIMGIVERKLREKEQRIQEILSAARVLFISKGYSNTTMLDIAEESELSRRTIYLYFKSKEELTYRVMKDAYDLLLNRIKSALDNCEGKAYEKLVFMKEAYMDFYKNDFDQLIFILLSDIRLNSDDRSDVEAQACLEAIESIVKIIVDIMNEGQRDGSLITLENPMMTACTFMTMIQSTMQKMAVRNDWFQNAYDINGREIMDEMFRILFNSLKPI